MKTSLSAFLFSLALIGLALIGVAGISTGPIGGGSAFGPDGSLNTLVVTNSVEFLNQSVTFQNVDGPVFEMFFPNGGVFQVQGLVTGPGFGICGVDGNDPVISLDIDNTSETHDYPIFAPSFNGIFTGNGSTITNVPSGTGITLTSNLLAPSSISFPATTVNWTNTTGNRIFVFINNSAITGTAIKINGTMVFTLTTGDCTLPLQPGEYFSETYTVGTPTATIKPF